MDGGAWERQRLGSFPKGKGVEKSHCLGSQCGNNPKLYQSPRFGSTSCFTVEFIFLNGQTCIETISI